MPQLSERRIAVACGLIGALLYLAAGLGEVTNYDYYGRLAQALLHGHWWLDEAPPWLNELLSCGDGRWCVAYPPLPAILAMPLVLFLPAGVAQGAVSQICGGASAGFLYAGLRAFGIPRFGALAGTVTSALGTTLLFSSADGRSWFAAHAVATLFLCAAFWVAARGERPVLLGALIGLAALARLPVAAAAPGLALLLATRGGLPFRPTLVRVVAGGVPFAAVAIGYDLLRWGSVLDSGYARLAEGDVFFDHGVFSLLYLPRHIFAIFFQLPDIDLATPAFLRARFIGMSLFITTPVFLWLFGGLRQLRDRALAAVALAGALALVPDVTHATVGFAQFGYRFSLDAQPFLVVLALAGDLRRADGWRSRPSWLFLAALVLAVAINIYAVAVILHLGIWQ